MPSRTTLPGTLSVGGVALLYVTLASGQTIDPSHVDLWDVSEGIEVSANSPLHPSGFDIRDMFGRVTSSSAEPGNVVFQDFQPAGFEHFVEWRTQTQITIRSFSLLAFHDTPDTDQRAFRRFTLRTKGPQSASFNTEVFELDTTIPYGDTVLSPNITRGESSPLFLRICVEIDPFVGQEFRAEFEQFGNAVTGGPRVLELDAFSTSSCGRLIKYPQIALGGGYEIVTIVSNEAAEDFDGTATLYQGNVEPWSTGWALDGTDMSGNSSFPISLGGDQTSKFVLTTTEPISSGYLAIAPQPGFDPKDIVVSFFYNFVPGGVLADSTGTPPATPARKFVFPVEFRSGGAGVDTGLAWAPFQATLVPDGTFDVTVKLLAADGSLFQEKTLPFEGHFDAFFTSVFDNVPDGFLGKMVVCAESAICLVVLRLELIPGGGFQLTSIPADILPE